MSQVQLLTVAVPDGMVTGERWAGPGPVVVFLHSGVTDRRGWHQVVGLLHDTAAMIAYDRRGFGDSLPATRPFRPLDDFDEVLRAAGEELSGAPIWLVGSSMGGGLALDAALTWPSRFAGLVLLAPAVSGAPDDEDALDPVSAECFAQLRAGYRDRDVERANRWHTRIWLDGPTAPEGRVGGAARELALRMNEIILRHELAEGALSEDEAGSGLDAWNRLDELTLPVTVACGELDVPLLVQESRALAERLPFAAWRLLPGTAHLPYLDRPEAVAGVIREALAGSTRRA